MTTVAPRAVLRNDPCPCGSGKRFKDCHGSLRGATSGRVPAAPAAATADVQKSRYRPAGDDWAGLDAHTCDRLGAMMELALKHQMEQRMRDAERLYRAVLEQAPSTHDALHMLGVVRLGLGDFSDAERLLKSAMALRPSYPAIEQNWQLVQRSIAGRDQRGLEIVCEHALPLLRETLGSARRARRGATAAAPASALHVVGPLGDSGSAAWAARRVGELLVTLAPTLWRTTAPRAPRSTWSRFDRNVIDAATGRRPEGGAVVLAHVECDSDWLRESIDRALVFAQASLPSTYLERLRRIAADGGRSLTMLFTSQALANKFGCDALVVPPPIDLAELAQAAAPTAASASTALRVATVGQDGRSVVTAEDAPLLKAIAEHAGALDLLDPGPLRFHVGMLPTVHCIARGDGTVGPFLARSDLYFHRARPWWAEDAGQVFFGAMALGVPVVCHRHSIYAEYVDDGVDGWLYDDDASALAAIDALRADRSRIMAAGSAARSKAHALFEPHALATAYVDAVTQWLRG